MARDTHQTRPPAGALIRPLAAICGSLAVLIVFWPDWIEALIGFDPDQHDGTIEWLVVIALLSTAPYGVPARAQWHLPGRDDC